MREATRDPKLPAIFLTQFDFDVPTEGWAANSDIDRHVDHGPVQHSDQLALRIWVLNMQSP
jgi:hypothetical protein